LGNAYYDNGKEAVIECSTKKYEEKEEIENFVQKQEQ